MRKERYGGQRGKRNHGLAAEEDSDSFSNLPALALSEPPVGTWQETQPAELGVKGFQMIAVYSRFKI